jgi:hypothetical protein
MPQTFMEYLTFVKGWEYIIAIAFVVAFIAFWGVLMHDRTQ